VKAEKAFLSNGSKLEGMPLRDLKTTIDIPKKGKAMANG